MTLDVLVPYAEALGLQAALAEVADIARGVNDATWLRGVVDKEKSLHEAVRQQCLQWRR